MRHLHPDRAGWVHGVDGLRVVDASVMSSIVRANTNLTTTMIGKKIAYMVKDGL
ncbi:MAG: choline dehydrogenase-like flavoprotein [Paracoccaceae bacterium]|jgi:choline dehydrogenase-like flavoprotein|tara:strand:+ start:238 stop:399 length:162 start_codon:yes stop_codon:yes gene_type:complete